MQTVIQKKSSLLFENIEDFNDNIEKIREEDVSDYENLTKSFINFFDHRYDKVTSSEYAKGGDDFIEISGY